MFDSVEKQNNNICAAVILCWCALLFVAVLHSLWTMSHPVSLACRARGRRRAGECMAAARPLPCCTLTHGMPPATLTTLKASSMAAQSGRHALLRHQVRRSTTFGLTS